jgi:hypothetical protein
MIPAPMREKGGRLLVDGDLKSPARCRKAATGHPTKPGADDRNPRLPIHCRSAVPSLLAMAQPSAVNLKFLSAWRVRVAEDPAAHVCVVGAHAPAAFCRGHGGAAGSK